MRPISLLLTLSFLILAAPAGAAGSAVQQSDPAPGHNFGKIPLGATYASQYFSFSNKGSSPVTLGQAAIDGNLATCAAIGCPVPSPADFALDASNDGCSGKRLNAGASCSLLVAFVPHNGGPRVARLALPTSETLTVESIVAGTGVKQPEDCIFDAAEKALPQLLPLPASAITSSPFYARCYYGQSGVNGQLCIGFDSLAQTLVAASGYIHDGKNMQRIDSLQNLAKQTACQ